MGRFDHGRLKAESTLAILDRRNPFSIFTCRSYYIGFAVLERVPFLTLNLHTARLGHFFGIGYGDIVYSVAVGYFWVSAYGLLWNWAIVETTTQAIHKKSIIAAFERIQ